MNFLLPDVFASSTDFDEWFDLGGKKQVGEDEDETPEDKEKHNKSVID